ncbi:hypothetical protein K0M31_008978 [Melipona bicolor]|uniref:CUB domain-containing protein n=1 Tax=Melipona bicolor TaxID=60889 RepID=A0AA40FNN4_9HYME|nr:hypothetical protein K0M31_008978 [Melipona bicolor]
MFTIARETWSAYITGGVHFAELNGGSFAAELCRPCPLLPPERFQTRPDDLLPDLIINPFRRGALIFGRPPPSSPVGGSKVAIQGGTGVAELRQSRNFYRFGGRNDSFRGPGETRWKIEALMGVKSDVLAGKMSTFVICNEDFGITTGRQEAQYPCAFVYNSNETRNGTFASPNYPGLYPRDTECHYFFNGHPNERVHLHFHFFDVEGVTPCEAVSASDFVEFSNYMSRDRKYSRHCGQQKEFDVESDRKFFRVTFKSNDRYDATGFNASYVFVDEEGNYTTKPPMSNASAIKGKAKLPPSRSSPQPPRRRFPSSDFHVSLRTVLDIFLLLCAGS